MKKTNNIISPFRGIRYKLSESRDCSDLITPPYDIITEAMQADLYARHEHNFIRLELPKPTQDDIEQNNRYTRAAATLRDWLARGILARNHHPSLYVLEQEFHLEGRLMRRRGVFALVRLPRPGERHVLFHEGTLAGPKADRLRLQRSCQAMISPVMMVYEDIESSFLHSLQQISAEPDAMAEDAEGVTHKLWAILGKTKIAAICDAIGAGPLVIADGHHRFETAMNYREEMSAACPEAPPEAGFNFALVLLVSGQDPGIVILPAHRLISGLGEKKADLIDLMRKHFEVHEQTEMPIKEAIGSNHLFRTYLGAGRSYLLTPPRDLQVNANSPVDGLAVSILHRYLIDPVVKSRADSQQPGISYIVGEQQAISLVDRGEYEIALMLQPTRISEVIAVAQAGERMPGKSTYFYPKAPAGLVISDASCEAI